MTKQIEKRFIQKACAQRNADLRKRSRLGAIIYLAIWALIVLPNIQSVVQTGQITAIGIMSAIVVLGALIRWYGARSTDNDPDSGMPPKLAAGILMSAIIWSGISSYILIHPAYPDFHLPVLLATAGLCAGAVTSLSPSMILTNGYLAILVLPTLYILARSETIPGADNAFWLYTLYGAALVYYGSLLRREYFAALNTTLALQEKSAKLEELNTTDTLTGLKNRRYFDCQLAYEFKRGLREGSPVSIILLQLDKYEQIVRDYGEGLGEESIKEVARVLSSTIARAMDIVARVDQSQFALILPNTPEQHCLTLAEKIRQRLENSKIFYEGNQITLNASLGTASCVPAAGRSELELTECAKKALDDALRQGNCVAQGVDESNVKSILPPKHQRIAQDNAI